jgi:hypothetical protein
VIIVAWNAKSSCWKWVHEELVNCEIIFVNASKHKRMNWKEFVIEIKSLLSYTSLYTHHCFSCFYIDIALVNFTWNFGRNEKVSKLKVLRNGKRNWHVRVKSNWNLSTTRTNQCWLKLTLHEIYYDRLVSFEMTVPELSRYFIIWSVIRFSTLNIWLLFYSIQVFM